MVILDEWLSWKWNKFLPIQVENDLIFLVVKNECYLNDNEVIMKNGNEMIKKMENLFKKWEWDDYL